MSTSFEFRGETFGRRPIAPWLAVKHARLAVAQERGQVSEMQVMAALGELLESAVAREDWPRFERLLFDVEDQQELLEITQRVLAQDAERPTGRPSDSSDGPSSTPEPSESLPVASVTSLPERAPQSAMALAMARSIPA